MRKNYRRVMRELMNKANRYNLLEGLVFQSLTPLVLDPMEAAIAKYFMVGMALHAIESQHHQQKARNYLAYLFFREMGKTMPAADIQARVLPRINQRLSQYHEIVLTKEEAPGPKLTRLGAAMVQNVLGTEQPPMQLLMGGVVWYPAVSTASAKVLAELEQNRGIRWWGWV